MRSWSGLKNLSDYAEKLDDMKTMKFIFVLMGVSFFLTSCANPFDLKALEQKIDSIVPTSLKASTNIVSGGGQVKTSGGYSVTSSIGVLSTLPKVTTAGGYSVSSSVNAD